MRLRDGDLVIAYVCLPSWSPLSLAFTFRQTDGLCDNVFASEMLALITLAGRAGGPDEQQVQAVTDNYVHYARACMINDHRSGPWARKSFSVLGVSPGMNTPFQPERSTRAGMPFEGGVSHRRFCSFYLPSADRFILETRRVCLLIYGLGCTSDRYFSVTVVAVLVREA